MTATMTTMAVEEEGEAGVVEAVGGVAALPGRGVYQGEEEPLQEDQPLRGPRAVEVAGLLRHPLTNSPRRRLRHQLPHRLPSLETTAMIVRVFSVLHGCVVVLRMLQTGAIHHLHLPPPLPVSPLLDRSYPGTHRRPIQAGWVRNVIAASRLPNGQ